MTISNTPFFEPVLASGGEKKNDGNKDPKEKEGPIRTQMVGEAPGEDLGYDPSTIPVEDIPDDDD